MLRVVWGGQFFNSFLPGSTGGDVYKMFAIGQLVPDSPGDVAATVILDRLSAMVVLAFLALAALFLEPRPLQLALEAGAEAPRPAVLAITAVVLLAVIASILAFRWSDPSGRIGRAKGLLTRIWRAILRGMHDPSTFAKASLLSVIIHLSSFMVMFCLARALHIGVTYPQILLIMPVVLLVVMLPVTVNGHGLREVLLIGYFEWMHLHVADCAAPREAAVALSVLYVTNDLIWCLPGGAWFALNRRSGSPTLSKPK